MHKACRYPGILRAMRKTDEQGSSHPFRSEDRFFRADSAWFYATREEEVGPFPTLEEARIHLRQFIATKETLSAKVEELKKLRREGTRGDPRVWNAQIEMP